MSYLFDVFHSAGLAVMNHGNECLPCPWVGADGGEEGWAGDTPFRRWKRETYRGGITDPCVVSWPAGISARGEVRAQYAHAVDIMPTLLEVIGVDAPTHIRGVEQSPLH